VRKTNFFDLGLFALAGAGLHKKKRRLTYWLVFLVLFGAGIAASV